MRGHLKNKCVRGARACQVHTLHCSLCQWHSGNHIKTNITALNSECCSREVNERGEQLWTVAERPTNFCGRCGGCSGHTLAAAKHQSTQTICAFDEESQVRDFSDLCVGDVTLRAVCGGCALHSVARFSQGSTPTASEVSNHFSTCVCTCACVRSRLLSHEERGCGVSVAKQERNTTRAWWEGWGASGWSFWGDV